MKFEKIPSKAPLLMLNHRLWIDDNGEVFLLSLVRDTNRHEKYVCVALSRYAYWGAGGTFEEATQNLEPYYGSVTLTE